MAWLQETSSLTVLVHARLRGGPGEGAAERHE